jgi:hypothetical protein
LRNIACSTIRLAKGPDRNLVVVLPLRFMAGLLCVLSEGNSAVMFPPVPCQRCMPRFFARCWQNSVRTAPLSFVRTSLHSCGCRLSAARVGLAHLFRNR